MNGEAIGYQADATVSNLDLQRIGTEFNVPALADDRYKSAINGHIVANGRGTTPKEMDVTASGTLTDSSILGGRIPQLDFRRDAWRTTPRTSRRPAAFAGFDPAVRQRQAGDEGHGRRHARRRRDGRRRLERRHAGQRAGATRKVTLEPSTSAASTITRATSTATIATRPATSARSRSSAATSTSRRAARWRSNDTGQSNLTVHADTPSLEEIGKLVDQPLAGIGKVDATVTGNRASCRRPATLTGNGVKYGDNGALSMSTRLHGARCRI